jgi:hypothetical protein
MREAQVGPDPKAEYMRRLESRRAAEAEQDLWHRRIGNLRFSVAVLAAILVWLSFKSKLVAFWWLALPAILFLILVIVHDRVRQLHRRLKRAIAFFERGIARLEGRWMGTGERGDQFKDTHHTYAEDLDLFGRGSLFELLCTAGTSSGVNTLATWLKSPSSPETIRERQAAIEELRSRLDLREDLAVLGADVGAALDFETLSHWGSSPPDLFSCLTRCAAAVMAVLAVVSLLIWGILGEKIWFATVAAGEGVFALWLRPRVRRIILGANRPGRDLALLSQVLHRIEKERFQSPLLQRLRLGLDTQRILPSKQIARLNRLVVLLDSRQNQIFAPLAAILLWGTQLAFAVEAWRVKSGSSLAGWLASVGEIEALCALASHAYEHPADPFPEIGSGGPCFEAEGIAHPLLPETRAVRNNVRLGGDLQVLVVSGSNMSGKSTLLRTVGTNAVLALAGAPVRAHRLHFSPLAVGASIRVLDSLQEGSSRFYAEITRIRQLMDTAGGGTPLLFLLDELLQGTNSHDRRIGAEAIIAGLIDRGAIGLLTSHDLALSQIADSLAPRAGNVHFEDHIENGRIAFDFALRPGVVKRSNALELMRSVGLDV